MMTASTKSIWNEKEQKWLPKWHKIAKSVKLLFWNKTCSKATRKKIQSKVFVRFVETIGDTLLYTKFQYHISYEYEKFILIRFKCDSSLSFVYISVSVEI